MNLILRLCAPAVFCLLAGACAPVAVRSGGGVLDTVVSTKARAEQAYEAEDWPAAEREYRRLTELVPSDAENWFRLGNVYVRLGRLYDAISLYREALVRNPGHARAWHNLGITQLRIATGTFVEMQQYVDTEDPLTAQAARMVEGITRLMENQLAPDTPEDQP